MKTLIIRDYYTQAKREEEELLRREEEKRASMTQEQRAQMDAQRKEKVAKLVAYSEERKKAYESKIFEPNDEKVMKFVKFTERALRIAEKYSMDLRIEVDEHEAQIVFETSALFFDEDCSNPEETQQFLEMLCEADGLWIKTDDREDGAVFQIILTFSLDDAYPNLRILK